MSNGFNRVTIMGYLGHDPEIRHTKSNIAVTTLNIGVSENQKVGEDWVPHSNWFTVVCLGKTAENIGKFLKKGSLLLVDGKLQNRLWEDQQGKKHLITEIVTRQVVFLPTNANKVTTSMDEGHLDTADSAKHNETNENDIPF
jgi:single-strand DNA-binding protein